MLKKIFITISVIFVLLIGSAIAIPFLFKDKIVALVKEEINKKINAKVDFGDFSISLFKDFPNLALSINEVSVINYAPFDGDTLASINAFTISLDFMKVIKGEGYDIKAIRIAEPRIKALVNKKGKTNWDIYKSTAPEDTSQTAFKLQLRNFEIANGYILYDDDSSNLFAEVAGLNINANGDFTQNIFLLNSNSSIDALTYKDGLVAYLNKANLKLKADVDVNQISNTYTFKENELKLNDLTLGLDGFVKMNLTDYDLDLKLNTKQTDFKTLLSLIPNIYKKDFANIKASGSLGLNAFAKGKYSDTSYPAFGLNLNVGNAMFQYPDLPTAVKNIFIDLKVSFPGGNDLDKTFIDLSRFNITVDNDPFSIKAKVRQPISDPDIDASLKGKLDLKKVPNYYPMEELKSMNGILTADVTAKGKLSAIEQERYQDFNASGTLDLKQFSYNSKDLPAALNISNMNLMFNPKNVTVSNLNARIGKSDFAANGSLDNLLNYVFAGDNLKCVLNVRSNTIDLNEFMTENESASSTSTTTQDSVLDVKVPANIDFVFNGTFNKILYDKIVLQNVSGDITVRDQTVRLGNLYANVFKGSALINGTYSTKNAGNPEVAFDYDLKQIDFQEAIKSTTALEQYAPVLKHVSGNFTSKMNVKGRLGEDLSLDLKTLIGDGLLEVNNIKISGVKVIDQIADKFKLSQLKNMNIDKAWTVFKFKDGKMVVEPFDLKVNDMVMNISGGHGLDNTLDYKILLDAPTKLLQGSMGEVNNLVSQAKIPGLSSSALPTALKLKIDVGGTMSDPKLKFGVAGAGGSSLKDVAKEAFDQKKKELEDKAKAELEAQKQNAKAELDKQKQAAEAKAKAEADKLKKQAEDKIKAEKEKAKNQIKDRFKFPK